MELWYSKELGDGMMAVMLSDEIERAFLPAYLAADRPLNMAVFTRLESEGRLHCEVMAYFSPAANEVAKAFGAQPCEKPSRMGLGMLAGDERSWPVFFSEGDVLPDNHESEADTSYSDPDYGS